MSVEVVNEQSGGGGGGIVRFTDSFQRPDEPFLLGVNWYTCMTAFATVNAQTLAANVNCVAGTSAQFGTAPANIGVSRTFFVPAPLSWQKVYGKTQFSQMKLFSYNGGGAVSRMGPAVMIGTNAENCYMAIFLSELGQITLQRGVDAQTSLSGNVAVSLGDDIRISVTPSAASNDVRIFQNGTQIIQVTDNNAARPQGTGMPGIALVGTIFAIVGWQNYVGGKGLL